MLSLSTVVVLRRLTGGRGRSCSAVLCCAVQCSEVCGKNLIFVCFFPGFFLVFSVFFFLGCLFSLWKTTELAVLALSSVEWSRASWLGDYLGRMRTAIRTSFCKARALHAAYPSALGSRQIQTGMENEKKKKKTMGDRDAACRWRRGPAWLLSAKKEKRGNLS